ncbi:hypothetical protein NQ317_006066 [Molorchus minor]|uniref:Uncharacterized protein n=1 Tax=Molorchus minor TaxID=1323400 RepID=A0ABQ9K2N3_9CUCU|nr:hypothetical protein NQ317_006066 [Molorchus minor]
MDSFVCKIIIFDNKDQRVLKPKKVEERNGVGRFTKAASIKKCLFGVAKPEDTEKLLQEQYEADRRRFNERFGFDIEQIENLDSENDENVENARPVASKKCANGRRVLKAQRRVFKQHNRQAVMTDLYELTNDKDKPNTESRLFGDRCDL